MRHHMPRLTTWMVLSLLSTAPLTAQNPLPELFQQGQRQFQEGKYQKSLETFERLERLSRQPGMEDDRRQLIAPVHFFRAANYAMLTRRAEAIVQFEGFLHYNPGATLEKGSFPEPVLEALDAARERMRGGGDIAGVYSAYRSMAPTAPLPVDADWAKSPVRQLMNAEERRRWAELADDAARREFVEEFWKRRDPTPETAANELRQELETRIRFAAEQWTDEERPGVETDRALVFAILGPPSFINVSQLAAEEDAIEALRSGGGASGPTLRSDLGQGRRETWTYRDARVPEWIQMRELRFEFLTQEGYGVGVLDKSSRSLFAIGEVAQRANQTGSLN